MSGSVRLWLEQISAVTDSVPEQQQLDRIITTKIAHWSVRCSVCRIVCDEMQRESVADRLKLEGGLRYVRVRDKIRFRVNAGL